MGVMGPGAALLAPRVLLFCPMDTRGTRGRLHSHSGSSRHRRGSLTSRDTLIESPRPHPHAIMGTPGDEAKRCPLPSSPPRLVSRECPTQSWTSFPTPCRDDPPHPAW